MPQTVPLRPGHGAKASTIYRMLYPSALIRENWPKTWQRERVEGLVLVGKDFRLVGRRNPVTNTFIMCHEYFTKKELCATKRMVHITEEGPEEELFDLERPSLESSIASAVVPPEEGIDRVRDKEDKETPLPILPSVSHRITVTEADISTLRCEVIALAP